MEEVNDIAFRILCKKAGAGITYTGMIHPQDKREINLEDKPVLQLFCTTTKNIKEFMKKYNSKVSGWDFNLGCPAKTARKHGFGVFLHHDLKSIEEILQTIRQNTKKFFSIKLRKSKYTKEIIKIAEKYCDAICIHPRTQQQGYSGIIDLEFAEKIKKQTKLPIIYSGNVVSESGGPHSGDKKNVEKFLKTFDYVMIGRRAIGNPNIFSKFSGNKKNFTFKDYLKLAEKYKLPFRQIKFQAMQFTKNQRNAKEIRLEIFKIKTLKKLKEFTYNVFS